MASQTIGTKRRTEGSTNQQDTVRSMFQKALTMKQVPAKEMRVLRDAPNPGEFCMEAKLSGRKADLTAGLYDNRVMPIECKVSNSKVNSVKRLNNDAAAKAEAWKADLGANNVVPVAVLSGVYSIPNMLDAQSRGLTLIWAHDLQPLIDFINSTKPEAKPGKKFRR
ncbi:XamI family restriction endonuclease [Gemmata sp. JC673]|uniref:XamI family restriction endonuclease n=1 Tax=Gemmata algarum TaxID=2975278 RepID=A0ABU5F5T3_9BACT|nr:XamI family restriction endonuclease [Gemmata algarum]MDY3562941.1 XamI family restriction endonuclease [Gemmata algarum]